MRPKHSNKTLTNLDLGKRGFRIRQLQNCKNVRRNRKFIRNVSTIQKIAANFTNNTRNTRYCEKTMDKARSTVKKISTV